MLILAYSFLTIWQYNIMLPFKGRAGDGLMVAWYNISGLFQL